MGNLGKDKLNKLNQDLWLIFVEKRVKSVSVKKTFKFFSRITKGVFQVTEKSYQISHSDTEIRAGTDGVLQASFT